MYLNNELNFYNEFTNQLSDRQVNFLLFILNSFDNNIKLRLDREYFKELLISRRLEENSLKILKNIAEGAVIKDHDIFLDNSIDYQLFCYLNFNGTQGRYLLFKNYLSNFFDNLVFLIDSISDISLFTQLAMYNPPSNFNANNTSGNYHSNNSGKPTHRPSVIPQGAFDHLAVNLRNHDNNGQFNYPKQNLDYELSEEYLRHLENQWTNPALVITKTEFYRKVMENFNASRLMLPDLEWLNPNDQNQLYWAMNYLRKVNLWQYPPLFSLNSPDNLYKMLITNILYQGVDSYSYVRPMVDDLIKKMDTAWYQKGYREKKDGETALNYVLSKPNLKKLKKLAKAYDVTPLEYLESLIEREEE